MQLEQRKLFGDKKGDRGTGVSDGLWMPLRFKSARRTNVVAFSHCKVRYQNGTKGKKGVPKLVIVLSGGGDLLGEVDSFVATIHMRR